MNDLQQNMQFKQALALHQSGNIAGAKNLYLSLLDTYSNSTRLLNNLARIEFQQGRFESGLGYIEKSINIDSKQFATYGNRGAALFALGRFAEAYDDLLARRSQRYGNLILQYNSGNWDWNTEISAFSKRYDNAANTTTLAGYALLNSTLGYKLNRDLKLQVRANNILDKDYVLAAVNSTVDYNTMGANVFFSLNYDMH